MNDSALRVWLVDDDASIRWVLERALRSDGMAPRAFEAAEPALDALRRESPDVLITDIRMPGASGLELLRLTANEGASIRVPDRRRFRGWLLEGDGPGADAEFAEVLQSVLGGGPTVPGLTIGRGVEREEPPLDAVPHRNAMTSVGIAPQRNVSLSTNPWSS